MRGPVTKYLPELKDSAWADATVQQTLDMTTGVAYAENFRDPNSGIFQYLHAAGLLPAPPTYTGPRTIPDLLVTLKKGHGRQELDVGRLPLGRGLSPDYRQLSGRSLRMEGS